LRLRCEIEPAASATDLSQDAKLPRQSFLGHRRNVPRGKSPTKRADGYDQTLADVAAMITTARRAAARSVNAVMTATYWSIGRRIVEEEQGGARRADYGEQLIARLATDLTSHFGRGYGASNLKQMRAFYAAFPEIRQTVSGELAEGPARAIRQTASGESQPPAAIAGRFPLPWSHYVKLLAVKDERARNFYEAEALRGGWTVRQLARQIDTLFFERTAMSKRKAKMVTDGQVARPGDAVTPDDEIKDPLVLEFLSLKDEYSESDLEEALIVELESFLLELGGDFTFVGRQRRLRIGDVWYRIDLLFFHRRLRCLVVIDLKLGPLTHADAGQMHLYLNYAREHWVIEGENPPVGLILCTAKNEAVAKYALEGLPNKVMAAEYRTRLPAEKLLVERIERVKRRFGAGD
jgi:predicted nuclease of restriction endonuclease-like (RecB) superfamily